ncbi:hypothetical protein SAMN05444372_108101 [Flavobacterium micromati]|uniref:Uncharacterized protein n=1 Tax=Flavobacterium micromati TaxID=229205 RepID=A0A1M5LJW5_9FLAO|nr:hypothetical protein SAMN05444372_108101 [Flavobacterium micromati]
MEKAVLQYMVKKLHTVTQYYNSICILESNNTAPQSFQL